jgi:penicillin amidase
MKKLLWLLGGRLPQVDGVLKTAVRAPVTIRRDRWGVPYIEAQNDHDAVFGVGFAQGQDRGFQLELYQRITRGTCSALVGKDMLEVDRLSRRIGFFRGAKAQLELVAPESRAAFDAFAEGVNAARASSPRPHELALTGGTFTPYEAADILAVLQFVGFALSSNWDAELARLHVLQQDGLEALAALETADPALLGAEGASRLQRDAELLAAAQQLSAAVAEAKSVAPPMSASNNWVLAPSRTATGRPLMAADPHLTPAIPAPWYLAHLRTPERALSGAYFLTQPLPSFGHNAQVAFSLTAGHGDNTDLVLEQLGPGGDTVRYGEGFVPCTLREEVIHVKGGPTVVEKVLTTPNGPIVTPWKTTPGAALSIRGTWMAVRPNTAYQITRAQSAEAFGELFAQYPAESENRVFADVQGNIGWQMAGELPVRKKGNGLLPAPGWDPDAGWEPEPVPFAQMPHVMNPPSGFVATANARPKGAAPTLGLDWLDDARQRRIDELLGARRDWTLEDALKMQLDRTNIYWRELKAPLLAALQPAPQGAEAVVRLLDQWDGTVGTESPAAAVYEVLFAELMCRVVRAKAPKAWRQAIGQGLNEVLEHGMMTLRRSRHLVRLLVEQPPGWFASGWREEIRAALTAAQATLTARGGASPDGWAWGRLRPVTLMHAVGKVPVLKSMFNVGPLPLGGDGATLPQASVPFDEPFGNPISLPNMRMAIDVGNWSASRWVLAGGQSGNPLSTHYADQLPLWQRGETLSMAWEPEAVRAAAVATLTLTPG